MTRPLLLLGIAAAAALTGCGREQQLAFPADKPGPARAVGALARPTPEQLMTPSAEARPERSDELLHQSDERQPDPFDLPPA